MQRRYRNDGFARYVCGILYEAAGDLNNAFIAYRNAYEAYGAMRGWMKMSAASVLAGRSSADGGGARPRN